MKRSRFSEEQIIGILKEHEAGVAVSGLCRARCHDVPESSQEYGSELASTRTAALAALWQNHRALICLWGRGAGTG